MNSTTVGHRGPKPRPTQHRPETHPMRKRPPARAASSDGGPMGCACRKVVALLTKMASAKLGTAAPRRPSATTDYKTVTRLSQRHKHLDEGETVRLIAAYQAGSSVYELAEHFGCHRGTVSIRLRSRGVQIRHLTVAKEQIDTAEQLYASGLTLTEVGRQMGLDPSTVRRRLCARGTAIRPPRIHCGNAS